jgi:tripartite-type tricarboxylate transporter receptor subunit TctC
MRRTACVLILSIVLAGGLFSHPAQGAEYPKQTIELLCPYPPGGSFDLYGRLIADKAQKYLGQPMVVINKPGGGGSTVVADLISSKPDGYKLGVLGNVYFYTTVKSQKVPFDPENVVPIANFMELKIGLQVKGDAPWKTLEELLDYGRKNPGKLSWGHSGRGLTTYMNTRLLFEKAGIKTIDIPYKGTAPNITALLGGHVDAMSQPHGAISGHIKEGTIRYLVVYADHRYSDLPGIPCSKELGFTDATKMRTLLGVYARKDTPEEFKKILFDAFKKTFNDPEFQQGVAKLGDEPAFGGPEFILQSIKEGAEVGVPILKELGMYEGH